MDKTFCINYCLIGKDDETKLTLFKYKSKFI